VTFRREARVPKGGPDGGDGGKGGDVLLSCDPQLDSLGHLLGKSFWAAEDGQAGMPSRKKGKDGEDLLLPVPSGTTVYEIEGGDEIRAADMIEPAEVVLLARGGKEGKGNARYKTPVDQAPVRRTLGRQGQEKRVRLVLRLQSDVCLFGYPNSGHSRLLERLTGSSQKVTTYPFSTRTPKSAFFSPDRTRRFLVLDLPSLGEHASEGDDAGIRLLRHAERCFVLVLVVSLEQDSGHQLNVLLRALKNYGKGLAEKKTLVVANKMDLPKAEAEWTGLAEIARVEELPLLGVSCKTGFGLKQLEEKLCGSLGFQN